MARHSAATPPLADVRWQVMFRGNVVMKGYLKAPEQVWSHGPYVTRPTTGPHHAGWVRGA